MRRVEIRHGFGYRRQPMHDPAATLVVSVLLATIVVTGFSALLLIGGGVQ